MFRHFNSTRRIEEASGVPGIRVPTVLVLLQFVSNVYQYRAPKHQKEPIENLNRSLFWGGEGSQRPWIDLNRKRSFLPISKTLRIPPTSPSTHICLNAAWFREAGDINLERNASHVLRYSVPSNFPGCGTVAKACHQTRKSTPEGAYFSKDTE